MFMGCCMMDSTVEAVSAISKANQELLASKDEEKKIPVTLTQPLDSQVKVLKSLSESLSHGRDSVSVTREDMFSHYYLLEEHAPSAARNGPVNTPVIPPDQESMYGVPNSDFGKPSFAPAPTEPTPGSFSRCYVETQFSFMMPITVSPERKGLDFHAEEARPLVYNTGVEERSRRWVHHQPTGVSMPEAAAAIRQPKSLAKQPWSDASVATGEMPRARHLFPPRCRCLTWQDRKNWWKPFK